MVLPNHMSSQEDLGLLCTQFKALTVVSRTTSLLVEEREIGMLLHNLCNGKESTTNWLMKPACKGKFSLTPFMNQESCSSVAVQQRLVAILC